jgi:SpoVK/Ycf46/Vps4 family AAA+-type ATPase
MSAGENFKFIFREAKINNAILFFDECEAIFETRDKGNRDVNTLLTEIER